jgi:hypothetical protein
MLRTVRATRYVAPLREGGSLPAIVEADDDGMYVLKFRGAGQGPKALIAELVVGEIGRALGLPVPEIVFVEIDPAFGQAEPDPEIKDLIGASAGLNLALDFLPGALAFGPAAGADLDPVLAAEIVWFDAYATNVDRTPRNPNLLLWGGRVWLIDHGAALYLHHGWTETGGPDPLIQATGRFPRIAEHMLLPHAASLLDADAELAGRLTPETIAAIVGKIPEGWLPDDPVAARAVYVAYLARRLMSPRIWVEEAEHARSQLRS